jgi:hypothetical protein
VTLEVGGVDIINLGSDNEKLNHLIDNGLVKSILSSCDNQGIKY